MTLSVIDVVHHLRITRVAHFTPSKNLWHILRDGEIRSSAELAANAPEYFDPTDRDRFDEQPEMVCCSPQFPNAYYLDKARSKPQFANFPDWSCVFLDPSLLSRPGVLFSGCNAAKRRGAYLKPGVEGLRESYAPVSVTGEHRRSGRHHPQAPTDLQAEVLIPGPINLNLVTGLAVPSSDAAGLEYARLDVSALDPDRFTWIVAPDLFDKNRLRNLLKYGGEISESAWIPPNRDSI